VLSEGSGIDHSLALRKGLSIQGMFVGSREMLIDAVFPFDDAPGAYRHLNSQRHMGKVVIVAD
jgi:NADPH:quinone reductase-like Zn-dependent oxidoreductase